MTSEGAERYLVYVSDARAERAHDLAAQAPALLRLDWWAPKGLDQIGPHGCRSGYAIVWMVARICGLFRSGGFGMMVVRDSQRTVLHRSYVFPPYFRFPFMESGDLQVGDTWTDPAWRGRGLATLALRAVTTRFAGRRVWYLTAESNIPSRRCAERAGLALVGTAIRTRRLGLRLLGQFVVDLWDGSGKIRTREDA